MTPYDILNRWAAYSEYTPNETKALNMLSSQYPAYRSCEQLQKIREFDPNGLFSVMYAKNKFIKICEEFSIKLILIMQDPDCLKEERELWEIFHSEDVRQMEESLLNNIDQLVQQVTQQKQLGARDLEQEKEALLGSIESVVDDMSKCRTDLYMNSGNPIGPIKKFSTSIHVFERLAECLLALERAEDGIYLCYINNYQTSDGYFGFFIKSNGNIFSINERQNEAYPGQHKYARNGRWQENKGWHLFPYNFIFEYGSRDYKGYAETRMIDEDQLQFFRLTASAYMPLIIAMVMLVSRYTGMKADDLGVKVMLTDALLTCNIKDRASDEKYALVIPEHSAIAKTHEGMEITMTTADAMSSAYGEQFNRVKGDKRDFEETAHFNETDDARLFISLYGDGFTLDYDTLLKTNLLQLATDNTQGDAPIAEFIGSRERFELLAYTRGREQLAAYIREQMFKEFTTFGGREAVAKWFDTSLKARENAIFDMLHDYLNGAQNGVPIRAGGIPTHCYRTPFNQTLVTDVKKKTLCPITGNECSIYFTIEPKDWKQLATVMGGEDNLPKIVKGWDANSHSTVGNSLLNMTDAVTGVGTPFEWREAKQNKHYWTKNDWHDYYFHHADVYKDWATREPEQPVMPAPTKMDFAFTIGVSKRGFTKRFGMGAAVYNKILGIEK